MIKKIFLSSLLVVLIHAISSSYASPDPIEKGIGNETVQDIVPEWVFIYFPFQYAIDQCTYNGVDEDLIEPLNAHYNNMVRGYKMDKKKVVANNLKSFINDLNIIIYQLDGQVGSISWMPNYLMDMFTDTYPLLD